VDKEKQKKAQRIVSVFYLLILAIIVGGTYLSEQQKLASKNSLKYSPTSNNSGKQPSIEANSAP
jgi:hypothetical protein